MALSRSLAVEHLPFTPARSFVLRSLAICAAANDVFCKPFEINRDDSPYLHTKNNGVSSRGWRSAQRDLTPCSSASAIAPACSAVQTLMLVCVTQIAARDPSVAAATSG